MPRIRDRETDDSGSVVPSEFGDFQETWDWIECESKSCPGKLYFFNLRSLCSTWKRPVARSVQLRRFKSCPRINRDSATPDVENNLLMIISSESEKENGNCNEDKEIAENNNREETKVYESLDSTIAISDCLQKKLRTPENKVINAPVNGRPVEKKTLSSKKKSVVHSSSDEEKENDDAQNRMVANSFVKENFLLPRKKQQKRKAVQKIVCEMYGTKTVSYDDVAPELPPGVKSTKLSDSSLNSPLWQVEESKPIVWNNLDIPNVNATVNLSSKSSKSNGSSGSSGSSESSESSESSDASESSKSSECNSDNCLASSKTSDTSSNSTSSSEKNI